MQQTQLYIFLPCSIEYKGKLFQKMGIQKLVVLQLKQNGVMLVGNLVIILDQIGFGKYYYNRQMRYQAKSNRSLSFLLKESLNPLEHKLHKENKENANIINFPHLKDNHLKDIRIHNMLDESKPQKKAKQPTHVSVNTFLKKINVVDELKKNYTNIFMDKYFQDVSQYMQQSSVKCQCQNMLLYHQITSSLRSKMIDWMIQVLSSYKMTEQSFFKSVYIMDSYLKNSKAKLEVKDLHLIGVASMFIATKYEEIRPLKLDLLYEKIARKKFRKSQILECQSTIIETLTFALQNASVYDISRLITQKVKMNFSQKSTRYLEKIILYLSKMVLFNSELAAMNFHLLAAGVLFIGLKTLEQSDPQVVSQSLLPTICANMNLQGDEVIEVSRKVLDLAKNYSNQYPSLTNLKKFNKFQYQ